MRSTAAAASALYRIEHLDAVGLLVIRGPRPAAPLLTQARQAGFAYEGGHRGLVARYTSASRRAADRLISLLSQDQQRSTPSAAPGPTPLAPVPPRQSPPAEPGPSAGELDPGGVRRLALSSIRTDERRFQNRQGAYSEASVARIVSGYDARKLDPIVVWRDPAGRVFVLSGHSRLEAHRRLGLPSIPVRFFEGSEAEAIAFARVEANRGATAESLLEDLSAFRLQRDGDAALRIKASTKAELRAQWGSEAARLDAYSYLSPRGKFLRSLALPKNQREQFPFLEQAAQWVGELRRAYPQLEGHHEDEMFDFLQQNRRGVGLTKDEFVARVEKKVSALTFTPERALGLAVSTTEEEARADTGPSERRRQQIRRELDELGARLRTARTAAEKAELRAEIEALTAELRRLERDIALVLRSQQGLFGLRRRSS